MAAFLPQAHAGSSLAFSELWGETREHAAETCSLPTNIPFTTGTLPEVNVLGRGVDNWGQREPSCSPQESFVLALLVLGGRSPRKEAG